jgi:dTDP-4-dehydrorhamnose 3,5-epimerase
VWTAEIDPSRAVLVPRGVANSYQTLEPDTAYVYLVNDHWSPGTTYPAVALDDPALGIEWPVPLDRAVVSDKDRANPPLAAVAPFEPRRTLVTGADGQLGQALRRQLGDGPEYDYTDADTLDITASNLSHARRWRDYGVIINAAAYTNVDGAETPAGRELAWRVNAVGAANLASVAAANNLTLVHISSDYVFSATPPKPITESQVFAPLGVYGATKAAADAAVAAWPRHYLVRTSWVVGQGKNFVRTMAALAKAGKTPSVVSDQIGRLTFAEDLAAGIVHLLSSNAPHGTYNLTNSGPEASWFDVAQQVFALMGADSENVHPVTTEQYVEGLGGGPVAQRPVWSVLDLAKIEATGFAPRPAAAALRAYLN